MADLALIQKGNLTPKVMVAKERSYRTSCWIPIHLFSTMIMLVSN